METEAFSFFFILLQVLMRSLELKLFTKSKSSIFHDGLRNAWEGFNTFKRNYQYITYLEKKTTERQYKYFQCFDLWKLWIKPGI